MGGALPQEGSAQSRNGAKAMSNAGDFYARKRREAAEASRELDAAVARGADDDELRRLRARLERARNVGD